MLQLSSQHMPSGSLSVKNKNLLLPILNNLQQYTNDKGMWK